MKIRHIVIFLAIVCVFLMAVKLRTELLNQRILAMNATLLEELEICDGFVSEYRRAILELGRGLP